VIGTGTGIIIDSSGNKSEQVDIIIYDSQFHPELFAQGSTVLFPVDVVYMIRSINYFTGTIVFKRSDTAFSGARQNENWIQIL
jgi:hypothetical protein